jgi:hypothetical protein
MAEVLKEKPEVLIIGTGSAEAMEVPEELLAGLREDMKVHVEKTDKAVQLFNDMAGEKCVAALHLTC